MPYFTHDGVTFHYCDSGEGLPVVFQHGLGCDFRQIAALLQPPPGFRLLSMDFRGHGETRPLGPPEKIGMAVLADDLLSVHPYEYGETLAQAIPGAQLCEVTPKSESEPRHAADVQRSITEFLQLLGPA